jgi:hypothetical protein
MFDLFLILTPLLLLLIVALFRFVGCSLSEVGIAGPTVTLKIVPGNASLGPGQSKQFSVLENGTTPDNAQGLSWSSNVPKNDGTFTAPYPWKTFGELVTVSYSGDLGASSAPGKADVTLKHANVTIGTVPPGASTTLKPGDKVTFAASTTNVAPPAGEPKFNWFVQNILQVDGPFGPTFTYTAPSPYVLGSGPVTVRFSIDADSEPTGTDSATVTLIGNGVSFQKQDATTRGSWVGVYGKEGYALADSPNNVISSTPFPPLTGLTLPPNEYSYPIKGDGRDLEDPTKPPGSFIAAVWYNTDYFEIDLQFTDFQPHQLAVYCATWDGKKRTQLVTILDGDNPGGAPLNQQQLQDTVPPIFDTGVYLVWQVSGHVILRLTNDTTDNPTSWSAVASGLFFDKV